MKRIKTITYILICCLSLTCISFTSCKTGEGCSNQQKYSVDTDKDGNMSSKRGKSSLFSKKQKKKKRK